MSAMDCSIFSFHYTIGVVWAGFTLGKQAKAMGAAVGHQSALIDSAPAAN